MLDLYRGLSPKDKAVLWAAGIAVIVLVVVFGNEYTGVAAGAQVAAAVGTFVLAVLAYSQVGEMRETRIAQDRPQVIVDLAFREQLAYVVVRNIGRGAARDITFEFSASLEVRDDAPVSELPLFERGVPYLAPGAELSTLWDSMITLGDFLEEQGADGAITITSRYKSLAGEPHETEWTINPLRMIGMTPMGDASMSDLVRVVRHLQQDIHNVVGTGQMAQKELRVSTGAERAERVADTRRRAERQQQERYRAMGREKEDGQEQG